MKATLEDPPRGNSARSGCFSRLAGTYCRRLGRLWQDLIATTDRDELQADPLEPIFRVGLECALAAQEVSEG
jgi:hypothetical protein